jgi:hypothetical protein
VLIELDAFFHTQAQPNVFVYTNPAIDNDSLPAIAPNFGLEPSTSWKSLVDRVKGGCAVWRMDF